MSFLKRLAHNSGSSSSATIDKPSRTSRTTAGEPCAHPGCTNRGAVHCSYIDRRERPCGYAWCPDHRIVFEGQRYCRRHGGVMEAIASNTVERIHPPDLDNRALSLCEWVSNALNVEVTPVANDVPPWISDRGSPISDDAVQKRRDEFRVRLVGAVVTAAKSKY